MQHFPLARTLVLFGALIAPKASMALPMDWHGVFGVDATMINDYRRIDRTGQGPTTEGSQEVAAGSGNPTTASFQTYVLQLNPSIIINDSATFKGEFTTGYGRGGRLGENTTQSKSNSFGNSLYHYNTSDGTNDIVVNRAYLELYADTATYLIGRHSDHWGLGAMWNAGENTWDRHVFIRDGLTAKIKIGNFRLSPYIGRSGTDTSHTRPTRTKEFGASVLYDNSEREVAFGLLYGKKESGSFSTTFKADTSPDNTLNPQSLGKGDIKIVDLYFKKGFGDLSFGLEVPLMAGEVDQFYGPNTKAKYRGKAFVGEGSYRINNSWKLALNAGKVSGHGGSTSSFDAMFLNPNYQIANILFRYNLAAVSDSSQSLFDSYITNAMYAKVALDYQTEKWGVNTALIWAKAEEVAEAGKPSYNHTNNKMFTAAATQESDLGTELDVNLDYKWNKEITLGSAVGYHMVGDYFGYTNDAAIKNETKNSLLLALKAGVSF